MIRRPPRSTRVRSSAASDVYKRQTLGGAFLMAFLFFGFLPHWLSGKAGYLVGRTLTPADFTFHAVDGLIKGTFLVLYIWGISFFPDIRRVFEYHGAEHKSICT